MASLSFFVSSPMQLYYQINSIHLGPTSFPNPQCVPRAFYLTIQHDWFPFFLSSSICVNACIVVVVVGGDFHSRDGSVRCYSGRIAPREKASWVPRVAAAAVAATVPQN
jgi:hypothetical protein